MMSHGNYRLLSQDPSDVSKKEVVFHLEEQPPLIRWRKSITLLLSVSFTASICVNALLLYQRYFQAQAICNDLPSQYARLRRDTMKQIHPTPDFSSLNRTIQDAAWEDSKLVASALFVALDEDYVVSQGLPHSMRWPWDLGKGVYIPTAAHEMHCVHVIRSFVNEKHDGVQNTELTWNYAHTMHCLNVLRETVMCGADDLPLYTGRLHESVNHKHVAAGRGMTRMCRNWDLLVGWATEHSACYLSTTENRGDPDSTEIERYKHCPDESRPWIDGQKFTALEIQ